MIDDLNDELVTDAGGTYSLRNREYNREAFGRITVSPDSEFGDYEIANVTFEDCAIANGRFSVFGASRLTNVAIVNLACDEYWFHADNRLDNVSISGGAGSILWLREPLDRNGNRLDGVRLRHPASSDGVCLDLTRYLGAVEILHAEPDNIRINPERHFICERARLKTVDWAHDPVLSKTHFSVMLEKASLSETGVYIGSLVGESGKLVPTFDLVIAELRRRGLVD